MTDPSRQSTIATPMLRFWRHWVAACSQKDLAAKAGISSSTISRLERGGRGHAALVQRLTDVLVEESEHSEDVDLTRALSDEQRAWLDEQQRGPHR